MKTSNKYKVLKVYTWYDTDILKLIVQRVFLTTKEECIGLQIKDDKIKIVGMRGYYPDIRDAFKNKRVFQKVIEKDKFVEDIKKYIDNILEVIK